MTRSALAHGAGAEKSQCQLQTGRLTGIGGEGPQGPLTRARFLTPDPGPGPGADFGHFHEPEGRTTARNVQGCPREDGVRPQGSTADVIITGTSTRRVMLMSRDSSLIILNTCCAASEIQRQRLKNCACWVKSTLHKVSHICVRLSSHFTCRSAPHVQRLRSRGC